MSLAKPRNAADAAAISRSAASRLLRSVARLVHLCETAAKTNPQWQHDWFDPR